MLQGKSSVNNPYTYDTLRWDHIDGTPQIFKIWLHHDPVLGYFRLMDIGDRTVVCIERRKAHDRKDQATPERTS